MKKPKLSDMLIVSILEQGDAGGGEVRIGNRLPQTVKRRCPHWVVG